MTSKINVLITGVGGRSVGDQILQALHMKKDRYRIIATDMIPFSSGLFLADRGYLVPSATHKDYINKLISICRKEKIKVVLPGTEPEVLAISKYAGKFYSKGIIPLVNPYSLAKLCRDKLKLQNFLTAKGYLYPKTIPLSVFRKNKNYFKFPLILKAREGLGGSSNVFLLESMDELNIISNDLQKRGFGVIIQEYIGDIKDEYTLGVMVSKSGKIIDSIALHRELVGLSLLKKTVRRGKVFGISTGYSQGFIEDVPLLRNHVERLCLDIGIKGPANIQLRVVKPDKVYIFEVHPRFSGSASIRASVGFNEPDILIQNFLFNREFKRLNYKKGYVAIRRFENIVVSKEKYNYLSKNKII